MSTSADVTAAGELLREAAKAGQTALSEYASKRFLAAYGVPVTDEELAADAADAVAAAERLGYPVAVKACSADLMHKSDRGLVYLNLVDAAGVEHAVTAMQESLGDTAIDGFLVQRMIAGKREIIVGGMRDDIFGACVMLGLGGILVEAVADVVFRLAPLTNRDAVEMVNEIQAQPIFEAFRGEVAVDREALSGVLTAVGAIMTAHPEISQVDVNPLIFAGAKPVAVDALITLESA